jgi:hypothetical protein
MDPVGLCGERSDLASGTVVGGSDTAALSMQDRKEAMSIITASGSHIWSYRSART